MDLEADRLRQVAETAEVDGQEPRVAMAEAVRSVVVDSSGLFSLQWLVSESRHWRRKSTSPPPCLAFLAASVLAAEDMGNADEGLAAHAYYPRLAKLLSLPDDKRVRPQYMTSAEFLWGCLNTWLENLEGERGLPTAYALTHRYVGLPMSQVLVRGGDRRKLPDMFVQFGLNPGMRLAPEDLVTYLDMWINSEKSAASAALRRLWRRKESHDRIAAIAAVELANWDGVIQGSSSASFGRVLLLASLRNSWRGQALDLALGLRPLISDMDGRAEVLQTAGEWADLAFSPNVAGLWRTTYVDTIDFGSMLTGLVRIRHSGGSDGVEYKRFPTNVVPLVYDELQSAYIQSERLQLGVDSLLLVRSSGKTSAANVLTEVEQVLEECARPGYSRIAEIAGLPEGWILFTDVQLFKAPVGTIRLNELVPLARNQLTIAGGLRIPSRIRKWSSLSPPEIRATAQEDTRLRVVLYKDPDNEQIFAESSDSGTLVVGLSELGLTDGDYHVALFTGENKDPTQQASLRLRSSDTVDRLWESVPRLVYSLQTPIGALTASEKEHGDLFVDGLVTEGESGVTSSATASSSVFWSSPRQTPPRRTIQIGTPDPTSCVVTGAHHWELPPALWERHASKLMDGTCSRCGLVKRFPTWLPRNRGVYSKAMRGSAAPPEIKVGDLPTVQKEPLNWTAAIDALMHLGGGAYSSLQSVAAQLDGSALFADAFTRQLEALGHIAIERNDRGQPARWEISPTCLAESQSGSHRLAGFWPRDAIISLTESQKTGAVQTLSTADGLPATFLVATTRSEAERVAEVHEAAFAPRTGAAMLEALPRLSEIGAALPRITMPGFDSLERFDLRSAGWMPCLDPSTAGAYRLRRGFEILYLYRSSDDVMTGQAAVTSVYLAKHLAANEIGKTFLFYLAGTRAVLTPQGCDLPGLYNRAAVAFSGQLPTQRAVTIHTDRRKCLSYSSIDQASADLLVTLFTT
ncbi:hypothetical protein [Nocardia amikacinitolerans]|uniref:hypothetical protein n=1 Tax=Nocardia amikacinitolerans TaxID=756689 RepID=UPI000830481F|nr:hypothetical protein [Nocardia amikacinitolerans]